MRERESQESGVTDVRKREERGRGVEEAEEVVEGREGGESPFVLACSLLCFAGAVSLVVVGTRVAVARLVLCSAARAELSTPAARRRSV